jgi:hypothetical protein
MVIVRHAGLFFFNRLSSSRYKIGLRNETQTSFDNVGRRGRDHTLTTVAHLNYTTHQQFWA